MKDHGYKAYGCELCPAWLHAKCIFPSASEAKLKILFKFNSSFDVKCQECTQKQKVKLTNLIIKEDFNNFTSVIEKKITSSDIDDLNLLKNKSSKKLSDQLVEVRSMISELSATNKKKKSVTECTKNLDQVSENFSNNNPSYS